MNRSVSLTAVLHVGCCWIVFLYLFLILTEPSLAAGVPVAGASPADQVREILAGVGEITATAELNQGLSAEEVSSRTRDRMQPGLAIESIAGHILGRKIWSGLNEEEKAEFIDQLGRLLQPAILKKIAVYKDMDMEVVEERISSNKALVKTRFTGPGKGSSIDFTLLRGPARWQLFDVNLDGVSLVRNLMAQIRPVAVRSGIHGVIAELRRLAEKELTAPAGAKADISINR